MTSPQRYDLIIVGGGITGAGIFSEAVKAGLSTLILEQKDFSWGTSSRSSKLVHGGLRYLKEGQIKMTWESVREREYLKHKYPGLIYNQEFLMPIFDGTSPGRFSMKIGLSLYDLISGKWNHKFIPRGSFTGIEKQINSEGIKGGFCFSDAGTDDARLVLRLIFDAVRKGGKALNYTSVTRILRDTSDHVTGALIQDQDTGKTEEIMTDAVINATGVWAEKLTELQSKNRIRPLKGSHLVFPANIFPIERAISFIHQKDRRPVFLIPWEGAVLLGTTDIDYKEPITNEPFISKAETDYLMHALKQIFPGIKINRRDAISSFSGLRPVLDSGKENASQESRDHAVWDEKGLISVTGGKLTVFRKIAQHVLKIAKPYIRNEGHPQSVEESQKTYTKPYNYPENFPYLLVEKLAGKYGHVVNKLYESAKPSDFEVIPGTQTLWAEVFYAAAHEQIRHLDDLLLRRVRLGLLLKKGGAEHLPYIRKRCEKILNWDEDTWDREIERYKTYIREHIQVKG